MAIGFVIVESILLYRYADYLNVWIGLAIGTYHCLWWQRLYEAYHRIDMVPLNEYEWPKEEFAIRNMDHVINADIPVFEAEKDNMITQWFSLLAKFMSLTIRLYEKEVILAATKSDAERKLWEAEADESLGRYDASEEARRLCKQEGYHGYVHYMINKQFEDKRMEVFINNFTKAFILPLHFAALLVDGSFTMFHEAGFFFADHIQYPFSNVLKHCKLRAVVEWHAYEEKEHALAELTIVANAAASSSTKKKLFTYFLTVPVSALMESLYRICGNISLTIFCLLFSPWQYKLTHMLLNLHYMGTSFYNGEIMQLNTWMCLLRWRVPSRNRVNHVMTQMHWTRNDLFLKAEQPVIDAQMGSNYIPESYTADGKYVHAAVPAEALKAQEEYLNAKQEAHKRLKAEGSPIVAN